MVALPEVHLSYPPYGSYPHHHYHYRHHHEYPPFENYEPTAPTQTTTVGSVPAVSPASASNEGHVAATFHQPRLKPPPVSSNSQTQSPPTLCTEGTPTSSSSPTDLPVEAPKPPRSAFICFRDSKQPEIWKEYGISEDNDDTLKIYASEWRKLSEKDRAHWDEVARNDKVRFVREKAAYKGPFNIPKRRAKKNPLAPKRPMSAFLKYSQSRRGMVKEDNPDMSNTDVSRLLGEMWRNASDKEKAPYREQEEKERAAYNATIKKWKADFAKQEAAERKTTRNQPKKSKKKETSTGLTPALMEPPVIGAPHFNVPMLGNLDHLYKDPILEDPNVTSSNKRTASAFRSSPHYAYSHHHQHQGYRSSPYRHHHSSSYFYDGYQMPTWALLPLQDSMDQGDETTNDDSKNNSNNQSDPLPVVPTRMPAPSHDEFNALGSGSAPSGSSGGQYTYRSNYFHDYMNMPPYYNI